MLHSPQQAHCVFEALAELGEGPLWHTRQQCLYWVDIKRQMLWRYSEADAVQQCWRMPKPVSAVIGTSADALLLCLSDGIYQFEPETLALTRRLDLGSDPENRLNDATISDEGSIWLGTMDDGETRDSGAFYYCDANFTATRLLGDICITNGPALNAAGDVIYFNDTVGRRVYRKSLAAGELTLAGAEVFVELTEAEGHPDGMCCDIEGNLYLCHWGSGMLSCYSPQGELKQRYRLPVSNVTKCVFGGAELRDLYITTARKGLSHDALAKQPLAGGLFLLENVAQGFASPLFRLGN